ncbi:MAG: LysR substrate-binding domain-containing protein [Alphaproteobacteria bacterium]
MPTDAGILLIRRAKLALAELRYAREELTLHQGETAGRVAIGSLPLARTMLVPRTITRLSEAHPDLRFSIVDGPYLTLLHDLRCGDLDLILGALRDPAPVDDVREELLFLDPLSILAKPNHPLAQQDTVTVAELAAWPWVVPRVGTPTRARFDAIFHDAGLPVPEDRVETSSLVAVRALLVESNRLTILSRHQIHYEEQFGILAVLPMELEQTERPIGITTRADTQPPPGVRAFLDQLRQVCQEL